MYRTLLELFEDQFHHYSDFLFGMFIGFIMFTIYDLLLGKRKLVRSYERIISSKDEIIRSKNLVIHGKLELIDIDKKHKRFFNRLKNLFKGTK